VTAEQNLPEPDGSATLPAEAAEPQAPPPRRDWRGMILYFDHRHGFSLWYPRVWRRYLPPAGSQAVVMVGPNAHDGVLVEVYTQPRTVERDDLPTLESELAEAISSLPEAQVLEERRIVFKDAIGFEKVYTFLHTGEGTASTDVPPGTWKKWVRFLFKGDKQYTLIAQAATVEDFDRLRPDFERVFESVELLGGT
jgi:hypothetical protein